MTDPYTLLAALFFIGILASEWVILGRIEKHEKRRLNSEFGIAYEATLNGEKVLHDKLKEMA